MTKEEEILLAAEDEFFTNGYDAGSTAAIAKRAGVTHAMVNYYYRTKEKLFIQILDNHVMGLIRSLKPVMQEDGDIVKVACDTACVIFDSLRQDRRFPFILSDISRTHPDFLMRYRDTMQTVCSDSIKMHAIRLEKSIAQGKVQTCSMSDIYNTVITLALMPFLSLPMLENVSGMSDSAVESFLDERREEMSRIIVSRYGK